MLTNELHAALAGIRQEEAWKGSIGWFSTPFRTLKVKNISWEFVIHPRFPFSLGRLSQVFSEHAQEPACYRPAPGLHGPGSGFLPRQLQ